MKRYKSLLIGLVVFFIVVSNCLHAKDAAKGAKTMDCAAAIAKSGADSKGKVTTVTVKALMAEAAKVGVEAEAAMAQALMTAYPNQAAAIATTALGCCSKAAVIGVFTAAISSTPASSWSSLQAAAVKANPAAAGKIAIAVKAGNAALKAGGGKGGIRGFISGGQVPNIKDEDRASQ